MTKNKIKIVWFYVVYLAFILITIYAILVAGDYALGKWISHYNESEVTKAELIERERIAKEDIPERSSALEDGYKPLFYPETIDNYRPLKKLAQDLGVAPLAPQPNSNLYFCNEGYGLIKYKTDRFGFRNQDKLWDQKIDAVFIGDSFTHGACVNESATISGNLLGQFNILNLGSYGNHAIHYAALEKTFIPIIKPKYAVTLFYTNDNEEDADSIIWDHYFAKEPNYFSWEQGKPRLSEEISQFYSKADRLIRRLLSGEESPDVYIKTYYPINFLEKTSKYLSLPNVRKTFDNYLKVSGLKTTLPASNILAIDTLKSSCVKVGCTPIVIYIPNSDFWRPDARSSHYKKLLSEYCKKSGVLYLDTSVRLNALGSDAYAPKGPHLSPAGYAVISKEILENIDIIKNSSSN